VAAVVAIPGLDSAAGARHPLHLEGRVWVEKNCYVDIWIELLHALRLDPLAVLGSAIAIDFEGDQWTFFKPVHAEIEDLYGIDVQELTVWKPLHVHALEHLADGKVISTEADAWWLPDTQGTDYRRQHTKTTILLVAMDPERRQLDYFHNAGYFRLEGEDYAQTFRLDAPADPAFLPLFAETVRIDARRSRPAGELARLARGYLAHHLHRRRAGNPVRRFGERFAADFAELDSRGLDHYHAWAFACTRQLGACSELVAEHLRWLSAGRNAAFDAAAAQFERVAALNKTFILKGARAINAHRPPAMPGFFEEMATAWDAGLSAVESGLRATG
jgi:hypothetical protein